MKRTIVLSLLVAPLLLASALPNSCEAQTTALPSQGLRWGVEVGDVFDFVLSTHMELYRTPPMTNVHVRANVTHLDVISDESSWLYAGYITFYWPNRTSLGIPLVVLPIGNWSAVMSHFERCDQASNRSDYDMSEDSSTFSVTMGYPAFDFRHHLWTEVWLNNETFDFSKDDGVPYRYSLVWTNYTPGSVQSVYDLVRSGYVPRLSSMLTILGSVAIFVELIAAIVIARRAISVRRSS